MGGHQNRLKILLMLGLMGGGVWTAPEGIASQEEEDPGYGVVYFQNPVFPDHDVDVDSAKGRMDFAAWSGAGAGEPEPQGRYQVAFQWDPNVMNDAGGPFPPPWGMNPNQGSLPPAGYGGLPYGGLPPVFNRPMPMPRPMPMGYGPGLPPGLYRGPNWVVQTRTHQRPGGSGFSFRFCGRSR